MKDIGELNELLREFNAEEFDFNPIAMREAFNDIEEFDNDVEDKKDYSI